MLDEKRNYIEEIILKEIILRKINTQRGGTLLY